LDELGADPTPLASRQHLKQRNVRAEHAVADGRDEADDTVAVLRQDDVRAAAKDLQVPLGRRRGRPADEETLELLRCDAVEARRVLDHASSMRVATRAAAPKIAPRPTSHASSRATVPHGRVSYNEAEN